MMRTKLKSFEMSPKKGNLGNSGEEEQVVDWELRPGGMLVQKRDPDADRTAVPAPTIRIRVKHGAANHEIYVNSQASFGELKKLLATPTGIHPQDMKLLFKDKERDSNSYLDIVGVKERSKIVLVEDPTSQERRYLEMWKTAKMEKASKSVSAISLEVDKLANQVSSLESVISKGRKVEETEVLSLIECLMTQLLKLDGIIADGDVKLQRRMQVKRVQKYVETLDLLKVRNATASSNGGQTPKQHERISVRPMQLPIRHHPQQQYQNQNHLQRPQQQQQKQQYQQRQSAAEPVVVTTKWETFDPSPALLPYPTASNGTTNTSPANKLNWEFFE